MVPPSLMRALIISGIVVADFVLEEAG